VVTDFDPAPLVVCPLAFERALLEKRGVGRLAELACCGPGPDRMQVWCEGIGRRRSPVVLAGLAGGLVAGLPAGRAGLVTKVSAHDGAAYTPPTWPGVSVPVLGAVVDAPDAVLTAASKASLRQTSGADVVDLESAAFARAATELGWTWAVVRGISDDAETDLPPGVARWTSPTGRTRPGRVATDVLLAPRTAAALLHLRRSAHAALCGIADVLQVLLSVADGSAGRR
jgi:hypothetical protein